MIVPLQTSLKDAKLRYEAMAILRASIDKVFATQTQADVKIAPYEELRVLLELTEARKQGRLGKLRRGRSLSVVVGVRNHLELLISTGGQAAAP